MSLIICFPFRAVPATPQAILGTTDVTSTSYAHYLYNAVANNGQGGKEASDNVRNWQHGIDHLHSNTILAINYGAQKTIGKLGISRYFTGEDQYSVRTGVLQGSNDSTNGQDGTWTTVLSFDRSSPDEANVNAQADGFGFDYYLVSEPQAFSMYRVTGMTSNADHHFFPEWEMYELI